MSGRWHVGVVLTLVLAALCPAASLAADAKAKPKADPPAAQAKEKPKEEPKSPPPPAARPQPARPNAFNPAAGRPADGSKDKDSLKPVRPPAVTPPPPPQTGGVGTRPGVNPPPTGGGLGGRPHDRGHGDSPGITPPPSGSAGPIGDRPGDTVPGVYRPPRPDQIDDDDDDVRTGGYWYYDPWGNLYYYDGHLPRPVGTQGYGYPYYAPQYPVEPAPHAEPLIADQDYAQPSSLQEAALDISRAWQLERYADLRHHLQADGQVRFYDGNEYSHTLSANAFRDVTEGVWTNIRTRRYDLQVFRILPGGDWAVLKGEHVYLDRDGAQTTLYVRYLLYRDGAGAWIIREVSLSDQPL